MAVAEGFRNSLCRTYFLDVSDEEFNATQLKGGIRRRSSRTSLFLLGLLYISLTLGLILIKEDAGVAWLGIHMIMIVMALMLAKHNRLCVLKKW